MAKRCLVEAAVARINPIVREKLDVMTGFGDELTKIRYAIHMFRFCDKTETGFITLPQFFDFMTRLHFVAKNREVEEYFNRFDPDMTGYVDYQDMAYGFFGRSSFPQLSGETSKTMEKIRTLLKSKGVYASMTFCQLAKSLPGVDKDGNAYWRTTLDQLNDLLAGRVSYRDLSNLLRTFDMNLDGHVNIPLFLRSFQEGMSLDRKRLIRALFDRLDYAERGYVTVQDITRSYLTEHNRHRIHGQDIEVKKVEDVITYMLSNNPESEGGSRSTSVSWSCFLSFYRAMSIGVDEDDVFEYLVRNSWNVDIAASSTASSCHVPEDGKGSRGSHIKRGLVVMHSDGREEVVHVDDELGRTRLDAHSLVDLIASRGVRDIRDIRL